MSLILTEGFDHQLTVDDLARTFSTTTAFSGFTTGRHGGQSLVLNYTYASVNLGNSHTGATTPAAVTPVGLQLPKPVPGGTLGFAIYTADGYGTILIAFRDTSTGKSYDQFIVALNFDTSNGNKLAPILCSGSTINSAMTVYSTMTTTYGGASIVTTTAAIPGTVGQPLLTAGAWNYIEIGGSPAGTGFDFNVLVNGVSALPLAAPSLQKAGSAATFDTILIGGVSTTSSYTFRLDDLYFCDQEGDLPYNTFLGPCHVSTARPTGSGSHTDFTPNPSVPNFENVSDGAFDGDTSYNIGSSGQEDTFASVPPVGSTDTILAVNVKAAMRSDSTTGTFGSAAAMIRSGGTDAAGASASLGASYGFVTAVLEADPATGGTWSHAAAVAAEIGYKAI